MLKELLMFFSFVFVSLRFLTVFEMRDSEHMYALSTGLVYSIRCVYMNRLTPRDQCVMLFMTLLIYGILFWFILSNVDKKVV